jgi:hypothetical protein
MKVKDLPSETNLTQIKVILPPKVLKLYKEYGGGERKMYIGGALMGDFFLTPHPPGTEKRRLYPMPSGVEPSDIVEWEVDETSILMPGNKVLYKKKTYDFGYYSQSPGKVVLYEEGARNMQDSISVLLKDVKKKK